MILVIQNMPESTWMDPFLTRKQNPAWQIGKDMLSEGSGRGLSSRTVSQICRIAVLNSASSSSFSYQTGPSGFDPAKKNWSILLNNTWELQETNYLELKFWREGDPIRAKEIGSLPKDMEGEPKEIVKQPKEIRSQQKEMEGEPKEIVNQPKDIRSLQKEMEENEGDHK